MSEGSESIPGAAVVYKALELADEPALLAAYARWLETGARVAEMYRWRRDAGAASGGVLPSLAYLDGELIGAVSAVPVEVTLGGRTIRAAWQGDSVVGPPARGKGVGKRLVAESGRGYQLLLAKSTSEAMYNLRKSVGFVDVPLRTYMTRVLSPRAEGSLAKRAAYAGLSVYQRLRFRDRVATALRHAPLAAFGPEFDALAERVAVADEVTVRKPAAYLAWRYLTCPGRRYGLWGAWAGDRLRGALVLRLPARAGERAWLVDLICETTDTAAMDELLNVALREARAAGAADLTAFASSARARAALARRGFLDTGRTPQFTYRVEDAALAAAVGAAGWNFWLGDGDSELYQS